MSLGESLFSPPPIPLAKQKFQILILSLTLLVHSFVVSIGYQSSWQSCISNLETQEFLSLWGRSRPKRDGANAPSFCSLGEQFWDSFYKPSQKAPQDQTPVTLSSGQVGNTSLFCLFLLYSFTSQPLPLIPGMTFQISYHKQAFVSGSAFRGNEIKRTTTTKRLLEIKNNWSEKKAWKEKEKLQKHPENRVKKKKEAEKQLKIWI